MGIIVEVDKFLCRNRTEEFAYHKNSAPNPSSLLDEVKPSSLISTTNSAPSWSPEPSYETVDYAPSTTSWPPSHLSSEDPPTEDPPTLTPELKE